MQARYIKVILFEKVKTRLMDGKIVGQGDDYILVERPQPKAREKKAIRKPREEGQL